MFMSVSRYRTCYTFFPRGTSLFKAALTNNSPASQPVASTLLAGTTILITYHHPHSSTNKFRIGTVGFLLDPLPVPTDTTCRSFSKCRTADTRRTAVPHSRFDWKKKFRPIRNYTTRWQLTRALRNYPALFWTIWQSSLPRVVRVMTLGPRWQLVFRIKYVRRIG